MARGSPAGSLTKKPFVLNARSNIEAGAVTSSVGSRDRKVSRMQMGKWLHFIYYNFGKLRYEHQIMGLSNVWFKM